MPRVKIYDQTLSHQACGTPCGKKPSYFREPSFLVKGKQRPIHVVVKDTEIGLCTQIVIRGCKIFTAGWTRMLLLKNSDECLRIVTQIGKIEPSVCAIQVPDVVTCRSM